MKKIQLLILFTLIEILCLTGCMTNTPDTTKTPESSGNSTSSFFWGEWTRMDNGQSFVVKENKVEYSKKEYKISSSSDTSLEVTGIGKFEKQSDSVMICDSIPYFRNGGTNLDYKLKVVGFTEGKSVRAISLGTNGIKGRAKSQTYSSFKSEGETDANGEITLKAPTINDSQTVTFDDGDKKVTVTDLKIQNSGDYMGTVAMVEEGQYNLKITGVVPDSSKDNGYLYGNSVKPYLMNIIISNIGDVDCSYTSLKVTTDDPKLTITSSENLTGYSIPTMHPGSSNATDPLKINVKYGEIKDPYVDTGIKITITNYDGSNHVWEDYIPLRFYKGLMPITVAAATARTNNKAALNGFVIYPDGNSQFFNISNNSSKTLMVPTFGKDKKYKMVFSGATTALELSKSTEMFYTVSPASIKAKTVLTSGENLGTYYTFGGNNNTEASAYEVNGDFEAYLKEGEIDYYTFTADTDDFYAPDSSGFYRVNFETEYGTAPVSFLVKGGTVLTASQLPDLKQENIIFEGWYDGEVQAKAGKYTVNKTVTLKARWGHTKYAIKYELGDKGINARENPSAYSEVDEVTLSAATRNYYTFDGWYDNKEYKGEAIKKIVKGTTGDKTFYAKWSPVTYKITYVLGDKGSNVKENPATYTVEDEIIFSSASSENYGFGGWFTTESFTGTQISKIEKGSHGDLILYAKWATRRKITYVSEYGTVPSPIYIGDGSSLTEKQLPILENEDYSFDGWYTNSIKVDTSYIFAGQDFILTAKWKTKSYTINYYLNDGKDYNEFITKHSTYTIEDEFILFTPLKDYYTFKGWYDNSAFAGTAITKITKGTRGNLSFYAKYEPINYPISYDLDGLGSNPTTNPTSFNMESETFSIQSPSSDYAVFLGWYDNRDYSGEKITQIPKGSNGTRTLYAKWQLISYSIVYCNMENATNNSQNVNSYTVKDGVYLHNPSRIGYNFFGWYDNPDFNGSSISTIEVNSYGNKYLYAKWSKDSYSIHYANLENGTNNSQNVSTYTIEDEVILYPATREKYTFGGWYDNSSFTGLPISKIARGTSGLKYLYAKWIPVTYSITYNNLAGASNPSIINYTTENEVILNSPVRNYYTFAGWYDNSSYTGSPITKIETGSSGNKVFYAKWTPTVYTITYKLKGGVNNSGNPNNYTVEDSIVLKNPTLTDCSFLGWYTDASYTNKITSLSGNIGQNLTLYAKYQYPSSWKVIIDDVTINNNGYINVTIHYTSTVLNAYHMWFNNKISGDSLYVDRGSGSKTTRYATSNSYFVEGQTYTLVVADSGYETLSNIVSNSYTFTVPYR